jgi:hypothetical protein
MAKLVCDKAAAAEQVTYYTIAGLPGNPQAPLSTNPLYGFEFDLKDVPAGSYSVRVSACNAQQCSLPAALDFLLLPVPAKPVGLKVL